MQTHSRIVPLKCSKCSKPLSDHEIENSVSKNLELMPKIRVMESVAVLNGRQESGDAGHVFDESESYEWPENALNKTMDMQCKNCINKTN